MNEFLGNERREPSCWEKAKNGVLVDAGLLRHVICNVDRPDGVMPEDFRAVLEAVIDGVTMLPAEETV